MSDKLKGIGALALVPISMIIAVMITIPMNIGNELVASAVAGGLVVGILKVVFWLAGDR